MAEVQYIRNGGQSILLMDFSWIADFSVMPELIAESIRLAQSADQRHSVLALIDLSGTRLTKEVRSSLKRLSRNNGPYIKAIAFVGLKFPWSLLLSSLFRMTGKRNHKMVRERSAAIQWLIDPSR